MSKLQARAETHAPQCGTGVPARQIVEAAREMAKLQRPDLRAGRSEKANSEGKRAVLGGQLGVSPTELVTAPNLKSSHKTHSWPMRSRFAVYRSPGCEGQQPLQDPG